MPSIQMYMAWTFSPCGSFMYMCLMALLRWELAEVAMAADRTREFLQKDAKANPKREPFPWAPKFFHTCIFPSFFLFPEETQPRCWLRSPVVLCHPALQAETPAAHTSTML